MRDVAREAKVSVNTVSRALSDKPDIGEETKARVKKIAKEMGYTRNVLASNLRHRSTKVVGVIVSDNANPYFAGVIKGIEDVLRENGYQMILCNTGEDPALEKDAVRTLLEKQVDGLLIVPVEKEIDHLEVLLNMEVPAVFLCRRIQGLRANYVLNDDVLGGYLAAKHIAKFKERPVFILCGPLSICNARDRLIGYKKALLEVGTPIDESRVSCGNITLQDGYRNMLDILRNVSPPISVLCFSDYVAIGALRAIKEAGLGVPEHVSIVGYDDIEFASCLPVALTTIDHPRYSIGKYGAEMLLEIIEGKRLPKEFVEVILKPELIIRESSFANTHAAPRAGGDFQ